LYELQLIARPVRTLLDASRTVAMAWVVWPELNVPAARVTETDATGGGADTVPAPLTVSCALPLFR
jgi:hypothetical protein